MKKADKIKQYNESNPGFGITGIKKMSEDQLETNRWDETSLYDLYAKPSEEKKAVWDWIHAVYEPKKIIRVAGSSHAFSVLLIASNGDILHITKTNNWLVEEA